MKKLLTIFTFGIFITIILTGCWDRLELEEQAYVVVLGIDQAEGDYLKVSFQIANPQVGSSNLAKAEREPAYELVTLKAPDFVSAKDLANISVSREITFAHTKTMIVSEEVAKSHKFLPIIEYITRNKDIRREINLIISKENAYEFIKNNDPQLETRPHKHYSLMARRWRKNGLVPYTAFQGYIQRTLADSGVFLAIYATTEKASPIENGREDKYIAGEVDEEGGNPVQMIGSAVIKEGKMVGKLTGEETRFSFMLRERTEANYFLVTYPDPLDKNHHITARLEKDKRTKINVQMDLNRSKPNIKVSVPVKATILSIPSGIDYVEDMKNFELLEKTITNYLNKVSLELVKKMQTKFKADPFQWYLIARRQFFTLDEYEKYNWMDKYQNAKVDIEFDLRITDFGKQLRPVDYKIIKD